MNNVTDIVFDPEFFADEVRKFPEGGRLPAIIKRSRDLGIRLWLYAGAGDRMLSAAISALNEGSVVDRMRVVRARCAELASVCQWLEAVAGDIDYLQEDPIQAGLLRAVRRLGPGARILSLHPREGTAIITPHELEVREDPVPMAFIDLGAQADRLRPAIVDRLHRVLHHGHFIMGPEIAELEARLAAYVGVKHVITCASGTDSLEIAMRALGIGPGDDVITVPFTWISTAETISQVGARPVFVDIDSVTYQMDPQQMERAMTSRTRAIMPVSLFGQMANLDEINRIAAARGIPVIEDGAQSFGATRNGKRSCGATLVGSTSFFPAKPLGCFGDGGALFTDDDALAERMRAIRTHGGERRHYHPYIGMNGRMDTLQAALVLAKMEQWDWEVERRGFIGDRYTGLLRGACGVPEVAPGNTHVYAQYTIRVEDRDRLACRLRERGIPTSVYYPRCLHEQPCFAPLEYHLGSFPEAERASREVISLPMYPDMSISIQDRVVAAVRDAIVP
jgi:UDP-2-acetamido-2-deoxy-ribo-hexuluronate aminotransferase